MTTTLHAVRGLVPGKRDRTTLCSLSDAMSFCLDQRAFGPRRLVVAFTNRNGHFRGLAHTRRPEPPEAALAGCIEYWFGCDDGLFRSSRFALDPDPDQKWWDVA